jgi:hypothetical protein
MLPGYPGVAAEPAAVAASIVNSCAAIDRLARTLPAALPDAFLPRDLRKAVADGLRVTAAPPAQPSSSLDDRTRAFVARFAQAAEPGHADVGLMEAPASVAGMVADFLDDTGGAAGGGLREEIAGALFKGWALHCGVVLASVYRRARGPLGETFQRTHDELTHGV